ncbi:MAG: hypothetical protein K5766_02400 [Alphaproteobacteria bacterium]|nr:hypothetical protein [Alphaproteobacteria bacterium]
MKNCIITPTFKGHFKYISDYLKSFQINATPKDNFEVCFTISRDEKSEFEEITKKFPDLNIKTLFFEDILAHFQIKETPDELLKRYKKFSFQTLKKFYTMLYLGKEYRFLVLDSESILYRPYDINQLFDNFFKAPFISGVNLKYRRVAFIAETIKKNTSFTLNQKSEIWFLENFVWFYDFKILSDLFKKHGSPIQIVNRVYEEMEKDSFCGIFEIDLYQTYIYQNLNKYHYSFVDLDEEFKSFEDNQIYRKIHQIKFGGECGLFENVMVLLEKGNIEYFANLFRKLRFNIIRCDKTTPENYALQKKFLNIVQPVILAASQDHYFGVKHNKKQLFKIVLGTKNATKLRKHLKAFLKPIAWLFEPVSILKYFLKTLIDIVKNLNRMS